MKFDVNDLLILKVFTKFHEEIQTESERDKKRINYILVQCIDTTIPFNTRYFFLVQIKQRIFCLFSNNTFISLAL